MSSLGRDVCEPELAEHGKVHGKVEVDDDSDDDDDIFDYATEESGVQLGTVVPLEGSQDRVLFKNVDWHDWDGGKAGGWPVRRSPTHYNSIIVTAAMRPQWASLILVGACNSAALNGNSCMDHVPGGPTHITCWRDNWSLTYKSELDPVSIASPTPLPTLLSGVAQSARPPSTARHALRRVHPPSGVSRAAVLPPRPRGRCVPSLSVRLLLSQGKYLVKHRGRYTRGQGQMLMPTT